MNNNDDLAAMTQVRNLLVGTHLKDIETRFQRQEASFQREIHDAQEALRTRLDSLENFMRSETGSLLHRVNTERAEREASVKAEQKARAEALSRLTDAIRTAEETFERRLTALSGTLDTTSQEILKLMQEETGVLNGKIDEKYADALNVLSETAAQIRHDMVYRSSLSNMFTEMVAKLSGQWSDDVMDVMAGDSSHSFSESHVGHVGQYTPNEGRG